MICYSFIYDQPTLQEGSRTIFDYYSETVQVPDGSYVNCEIMDTGGQEEFNAQNKIYYKRADCCLLVYDITNQQSFDEIENYYVKEIKDNCIENIPVILLGNKTDLEGQRVITIKDGTDLATKYNFTFMETSCEENYNVANAFETLILMTNDEMIKNKRFNYNSKENINTFQIKNQKKHKKGKCCSKK